MDSSPCLRLLGFSRIEASSIHREPGFFQVQIRLAVWFDQNSRRRCTLPYLPQ
jgi:hypothetical protein